MPVTTTYPGVYIEELSSLNLSVTNSATAVPVLAVSDWDSLFDADTSYISLSSWLDYQNLKNAKQAALDESQEVDADKLRDICMRVYFENGGGRCYLVKISELDTAVPLLTDATLLVSAGQNIRSNVSMLCKEGKNLFAILDGPETEVTDVSWKDGYDETAYSALYYPWLKADSYIGNIPPSVAIAGAYCLNDSSRGVWKAPANMALSGGVQPIFKVNDDIQGQYTSDKALNMIRQFNNGSPVIWGARTTEDTNSWRYVPVRRLFNSVEKDVQNAMQFAMFEPNSQPTWEAVRSAINNYLFSLWQQGALAGAKPEEAFFVKIGKDITMTDDDINQGKMIVKVGMAAVRPAEFIILQFTQDVTQ
jgi:phage tail sheath protein FI